VPGKGFGRIACVHRSTSSSALLARAAPRFGKILERHLRRHDPAACAPCATIPGRNRNGRRHHRALCGGLRQLSLKSRQRLLDLGLQGNLVVDKRYQL